MGCPVVGTTLASKPMSWSWRTHHSAALRHCGLYSGSVETLGMRISSNSRSSAASCVASSFLRTWFSTGTDWALMDTRSDNNFFAYVLSECLCQPGREARPDTAKSRCFGSPGKPREPNQL